MSGVTIRPLRADDLETADRIFRLAFGTFVGLPDPMQFAGDSDWVRARWLARAGSTASWPASIPRAGPPIACCSRAAGMST
jgi:hypothetical protein